MLLPLLLKMNTSIMRKYLFTTIIFSLLLIGCKTNNSNNNSTTEFVEINGVNHFIEKIGKGEPLLVLHGGPGLFHDYLVPYFKHLSKKYQIIFYDQRGCGKTDFPTDTSTITLKNYVTDLEAIRKYLKIDKLNLVSHSWGSMIALNYGKKYPNHLKKLILISPAPATNEFFDETFTKMRRKRNDVDTKQLVKYMMSSAFEKRDTGVFKKAIMLGDKVNLVNQESINELYRNMHFTPTSANNLLTTTSILEHVFFNYDITKELENITCKTLILYGDLDNVPFASAQYLQEHLSNAQLVVVKRACNYPFFESPKEFNFAIKQFLNPAYED